MKILCILMTFAVFAFPLRADDEQRNVRALLKAQAEQWDRAIVEKKRSAIEANLADDFLQIDGDGVQNDRAGFIAELMDPELEIEPYTVEDFDLRVFGDVALLSGRTSMKGKYKGKPFVSHYRYIDIYHQEEGRWKVVNVQITRIRQPS